MEIKINEKEYEEYMRLKKNKRTIKRPIQPIPSFVPSNNFNNIKAGIIALVMFPFIIGMIGVTMKTNGLAMMMGLYIFEAIGVAGYFYYKHNGRKKSENKK